MKLKNSGWAARRKSSITIQGQFLLHFDFAMRILWTVKNYCKLCEIPCCVEQHIKLNYLKFYCVMSMFRCVEWIISLEESVQSPLRGSKRGQAKVLMRWNKWSTFSNWSSTERCWRFWMFCSYQVWVILERFWTKKLRLVQHSGYSVYGCQKHRNFQCSDFNFFFFNHTLA